MTLFPSHTKPLTSLGKQLDTGKASFGELRRSDDVVDDVAALRQRMIEDGYLYIPRFWKREEVANVRHDLVASMIAAGMLHSESTEERLLPVAGKFESLIAKLAMNSASSTNLLFGDRLMAFWQRFFREDALHFDYIWQRAMARGFGTAPHCDIVYMGRGTQNLFTCWVPYGDISLELGGLMVLEGSHRQADRLAYYMSRDVDEYCENRKYAAEVAAGQRAWQWDGKLANDPVTLRSKLGGRWLTTEFQMGDLVTFGMGLVHGSIDNATDQVRLSSDTRYQRASEPADERWIGAEPIGHGLAGKRGRIC